MIYLQEGNFPLNEAFSSEIVQEANSTYQLTFKFPTSDPKWALLTPETELVADDLHGEQYFTIFEVEKQHGYVTVYANQVATLLNGYSINKINVDRVNGATVMNALVAGFKRETPFTFFSDVMSKHTLNLKDISAMEALAKEKHSIVGQWGGDLVRDKYSVRLLENGGIENESLFAYKKNMKSFQESKSTKELRTRIHFKKVIEAHEEGKKDQILTVTIDSPLINKYKHIYEADMEVQDQDVVDRKTLEEYGKRYFRETLCDMIEESLEIDVVGQADQPVHIFDIVSVFHEGYDVDLRKKITKYKFNPMSVKLVSIGFGEFAKTLADSISGMLNDSVDKKMKSFDAEYEAKVQKLVDNANAEYDKQSKELEHKITDGIEQAKAQAEVVKQEISGTIDQKISGFKQSTDLEIEKAKAKAEEALSKAGTFPNMESISAKLKDEILKSKDLNDKINRTFSEMDNGTEIFNKISGQVTKKLVEVEGQVNQKINQTNQRIGQVNNELLSTNREVDQTNNRIDRTNRNLEATNRDLANINSQVAANTRQIEVQVTNYNAVRESTKLFERILGTTEEGAPNKLSRLIMSSEIFQTEVGKYVTDDNNLIVNSMTMSTNTLVGNSNPKANVSVNDGIFTIKAQGLTGYNWSGFTLPIYVKKIYHGETYTLGFKYRIKEYPDSSFAFNIKNHGLNKILLSSDIGKNRPPLNEWQEFQKTFTVQEDFAFGEDANYPFYIYLAKNGWIEFKEPILVRGSNTGPYKPSQFDDAFAETKALGTRLSSAVAEVDTKTSEAKQLAIGAQARADQANGLSQTAQQTALDAQQKAIQVAEQARQAQATAEATRTQVTQLAGSFAIKNINSAGDIISGINLGADGNNRFVGKLTHITGETQIDNAVIKSAMVDKLKTGNFESGSVTTQILASDSVTADKLLVDSAMINKLVSNQAFIKELTSQKAFITQLASVDFSAEHIKGGRLSANSGSTVFDLDNGTLNLYSNTGTIRRIDDTNSSQFIKLMKSGFVAEKFRDTNAALMVIGTNHNKDPKVAEAHDNATFAGIRIWSGKGNGTEESLTEFIGDRVLIYNNKKNRSPWNFHNNMQGKETYLLPMNENGVKHYIGRGDFFLEAVYSRKVILANGKDAGAYLWDLLTCFGMMVRYGMISNSTIKNHIQGILNGYGFRV